MNPRRSFRRGWLIAAALLIAMISPAGATERWGKVKSVDARFEKFTLIQDGSKKEYEIRIGPDTDFVLLDGRVVDRLDISRLKGRRIFATVEENPAHYAMKIWFRKDVPPSQDPINPGVGAAPLR